MTLSEKQAIFDSTNLNDRRLILYNEKEACAILGISPVTLWRLRKAKTISFRRVCNSLRYSEADLAEFLERSKQSAVAA